jgi:hypothetical protein
MLFPILNLAAPRPFHLSRREKSANFGEMYLASGMSWENAKISHRPVEFSLMNATPLDGEKQELSPEEAQRRFRQLVTGFHNRCLWFMDPRAPIDIFREDAPRILEQIARNAPRSAWVEARKLKQWRLHHTR